jgi:exodeoxyribonuclease VII small subunit
MATKSDKLSFEETITRLETIASELEGGKATLEESLELYNEGIKLIKSANLMLDNAEKKISASKKNDEDASI